MFDVDALLLRGEKMRRRSSEHPMGLVARLGRRALQLVLLYAGSRLLSGDWYGPLVHHEVLRSLGATDFLAPLPDLVGQVCGYLAFVVLGLAAFDVARWRLTTHLLTDQRVLKVFGVLDRVVVDMPLDTIIDTAISQSVLGQALSYGHLLLRTPSAVGNEPLEYLRDPHGFRQAYERARQARVGLARHRHPDAPGAPSAPER